MILVCRLFLLPSPLSSLSLFLSLLLFSFVGREGGVVHVTVLIVSFGHDFRSYTILEIQTGMRK